MYSSLELEMFLLYHLAMGPFPSFFFCANRVRAVTACHAPGFRAEIGYQMFDQV